MNYLVALVTAATSVACLSSPSPLEEETRADTTPDADGTSTEVETTEVVEVEVEAALETEVETTEVVEVETVEETEVETTQDVEVETNDDAETLEEVVTPRPLDLSLAQSADLWLIENERIKMALEARSGWLPSQVAPGPSAPNIAFGAEHGQPNHTGEEWLGLTLFPVVHAWENDVAPDVQERGPAVVQVDKSWVLEARSPPFPALSGQTRITVHADGRVIIAYDIRSEVERLDTYLVAYAAFDIDFVDHVSLGGDEFSMPSGQVTPDGSRFYDGTPATPYLCVRGSGLWGAMAAGFIASPTASPASARVTENAGNGTAVHSVRLQYDLSDGVTPAGSFTARYLLVLDDADDCSAVANAAAAFREPPALTATNGEPVVDAAGDADRDGFIEASGAYAVRPTSHALSFTLAGPVPSLTLRVLSGLNPRATVSLGGVPLVDGRDFIAAPSSEQLGGWLVILRPVPAATVVDVSW